MSKTGSLRLKKKEDLCPTSLEKNTSFQELLATVKLDCDYFHDSFSQRRDDLLGLFYRKGKTSDNNVKPEEVLCSSEIWQTLPKVF